MKKTRAELVIYPLIFLIVFFSHFFFTLTSYESDPIWATHIALSIVKEGDTDLDEFEDYLNKIDYSIIEKIDGHYYNFFPIGVSILAVPFVYLLDISGVDVAANNGVIQKLIACFISAVTSIFIYLIARFYLRVGLSLWIVFSFAFCTSIWSTASGALWQHGPSMLMLAISLYLILAANKTPWLIQFASLPLAFSYLIRPTNFIFFCILSIFIFDKFRKFFLPYILWSLPVLLPFLIYNFAVYHKPLSNYYAGGAAGGFSFSSWDFFGEGPLALLISPSRGFFIFTPIFLFSIWGIILRLRSKSENLLDYLVVGIIVFHWLISSSTKTWWGGFSYGPRYLFDIIPCFIYFLIPAIEKLSSMGGRKKVILTTFFALLLSISFLIQFRGATSWDAFKTWNKTPISVDDQHRRVWDWTDIQFLRGL